MDILIIAVVVYFSILTQAVTGSGLALISMPILVHVLDPITAATMVAMMALTTQSIMLLRYHRALTVGSLWRLILGSLLGIPLGVLALANLDERIILTVLGLILIGYSLYSLFTPRLPEIKRPAWGYLFGFISGLLGGAYNTGGPPFVIYGMSVRWAQEEYKANLQVLLMVNSATVAVAHAVAGHYTPLVFESYLVALPMIVLGALSGFVLDRYINPHLFRRLVLVVLLLLGVRMLLP